MKLKTAMTYQCTKNLYMKDGTKVFTNGKKYDFTSTDMLPYFDDAPFVAINDLGATHVITEGWAKHFKEVK